MKYDRTFISAVIFSDIYHCRIGDFLSSGIYKCYFDRYNLRSF